MLRRIASYLRHRWNEEIRLDAESAHRLFTLLEFLVPHQAVGCKKVRLGSDRDGGYVMLDHFEDVKLALSLGIGPDISWDVAIAERGIPVWQYDHTVAVPPQLHALHQFHALRVVANATATGEIPLSDLLGQAAACRSIVKMDIEGDEWTTLSVEPALWKNCTQLIVEFHDFQRVIDPAWCEQACRVFASLQNVFDVVHVHANNLSKHLRAEGRTVPDSLEVTFANRTFYGNGPCEETFPGALDRPNNPYFPDFRLGHFRFENRATSRSDRI